MIVTLLTDYGHADEFVGILHGVIRTIAPDARIIDLAHAVPRHDIRRGALIMRNALPYLPVGVHVAVVDPQVGTERRAVAIGCADGRMLVGPDNGLLSLAAEAAGGALEAVDITRSQHRLEPVSATFHGRDVFAPVAARLAAGAELVDAGEPLDVDELERLELPVAGLDAGAATAHALAVDIYGNLSLDLTHEQLLELGLTIGSQVEVHGERGTSTATVVQTFADVEPGAMLLYEDAFGAVALAINRGDAAAALGLARDGTVRIEPA